MSAKVSPFPSTTPIVGQPFTVKSLGVPMNMQLTCNCGGADTEVAIVGSVSSACPSCRRVYNAIFNPQTGEINMQIGVPADEKEPS